MEMKENYNIRKAENGYYVEVYNEDEASERKVVFTTVDELRNFMTATLMSELNKFDCVNVTMDWL